MLFEGGDPGLELFGVLGPSDAGLVPDLVAEYFTEALLKAADLTGEASCARVGGCEVGLERWAADCWATAVGMAVGSAA